MKKLFKMLPIVMIMSLIITGCGLNSKPDSIVKKYCDAMKTLDLETMSKCTANGTNDDLKELFEEEEDYNVLTEYLKENAAKMKYSITDTQVDGDKGTVKVKFTYLDASPMLASVFGEYITQAFGLAFSGASEDAISDLFTNIFNEKKESMTLSTTETEVTFTCVKKDKEWLIEDASDELLSVVMCNMNKTFESMGGESPDSPVISDQPDSDEGEEEEEMVWTDVHPGEAIELATIKVTVNGSEEKTKLEDDWSSIEAQDGTKFVVISVTLENITKETMTFRASDLPLADSQDRNYNLYDSAFLYMNDALSYPELAPNIPKTGYLVYNVPADSEGYYFYASKAETNEAYRFFGN